MAIEVFSPTGRVGTIPDEYYKDALDEGYRPTPAGERYVTYKRNEARFPLEEGEVRGPTGLPGTLLPTTKYRSGGVEMEGIGTPEEYANYPSVEVLGPGKGSFRARRLPHNADGSIDYAEAGREILRGAVRGQAQLIQSVVIDTPEALGAVINGEGWQGVKSSFLEKGYVTGAAEGFVDQPHTGIGIFTEGVTPFVSTPGVGAVMRWAGKGLGLVAKGLGKITGTEGRAAKLRAAADMEDFENAAAGAVAEGANPLEAVAIAEGITGKTKDDILALQGIAKHRLRLPANKEEARAIMFNSNMEISASGKLKPIIGDMEALFKPVYDKIRDLDGRLWNRLMTMEARERTYFADSMKMAAPMVKEFGKLAKTDKRIVHKALLNGDFQTVREFISKDAMDAFEGMTKEMWRLHNNVNKKLEFVEHYYPRIITDMKGLFSTMKREHKEGIIKQFAKFEEQAGRAPNEVEQSNIITAIITGKSHAKIGNPSSAYARRWGSVPGWARKYYATPEQAISIFLKTNSRHIVKRQFLGGFLKEKNGLIDAEASIGNYVAKQLPYMSSQEANAIKEILKARFTTGEQSPGALVQSIRNLTYTGTIGNTLSALTQAKDVGIAMARYGLSSTIRAVFGKRYYSAADAGLNLAGAELEHSLSRTARIMEGTLKWSGFQAMDQFGKNVQLGAALRKLWKLADTEKGQAIIKKKWLDVYGVRDTERLIEELQSGKITPMVKQHLFNELAEIQPITLGQVPLRYLQSPNGRIFYTLNTFTLRQMSMLIKAAKGKGALRGAAELGKYAIYMGIAGAGVDTIKDLIKGKNPDTLVEDLPLTFGTQMLSTFYASRYVLETGLKGLIGSATIGQALQLPSVKILDTIGRDVLKLINGKMDVPDMLKHFGPFAPLYYWLQDDWGMRK